MTSWIKPLIFNLSGPSVASEAAYAKNSNTSAPLALRLTMTTSTPLVAFVLLLRRTRIPCRTHLQFQSCFTTSCHDRNVLKNLILTAVCNFPHNASGANDLLRYANYNTDLQVQFHVAQSDMPILISPRHDTPSTIKHPASPRVAAVNGLVEELLRILRLGGIVDLEPR